MGMQDETIHAYADRVISVHGGNGRFDLCMRDIALAYCVREANNYLRTKFDRISAEHMKPVFDWLDDGMLDLDDRRKCTLRRRYATLGMTDDQIDKFVDYVNNTNEGKKKQSWRAGCKLTELFDLVAKTSAEH